MTESESPWSIDEVLPLLRQVSLFQGLDEADLERIAGIVRGTRAEGGETIFEEGDPGDAYYVVFRGAVAIVKQSPDGEEKLAVRRDGEGFGEMALIDDSSRSAGARAEVETQLLLVLREDFHTLLGEDTLASRMLRALASSLRALNVRFAQKQGPESSGEDVWEVSRTLQRSLVPKSAPKVDGFDIAAGTSLEEEGEGRTVWDSFPIVDGRIAIVSLLVRGPGGPPAHLLGVARALLRELARGEEELVELLPRVNEGVAGASVDDGEQFAECGILVPSGGENGLDRGGAPPGCGDSTGREPRRASHPRAAPRMMGGFRYGTHQVSLGSGDVVLVLSEASKGLFRGAADLVATLQGKPVGEVVSTVHRALRKAHDGSVPETTVVYARKK